MITITTTELKDNLDKYLKLGQKEEIDVTHRGELIFTIVPKKEHLKKEWTQFYGSLPKKLYDEEAKRE